MLCMRQMQTVIGRSIKKINIIIIIEVYYLMNKVGAEIETPHPLEENKERIIATYNVITVSP